MTIRTLTDYGASWRHNGVCYSRVSASPSMGVPTDSAQPGDVLNYADYTWSYDDLGVSSGDSHRTWTACEMCVAKLPAHSGSTTSATYVTVLTAPSSGVMRVWKNGDCTWGYRINGVETMYGGGSGGSYIGSRPLRLVAGDVVEIKTDSNSIGFVFCPFVYP